MIVYHEYKAVNFLKNYIYSFLYLKSEFEQKSILLYPDGADYFIYDGDTLQVITKNQIKKPYSLFLKKGVEYFVVRWKPCSFYFLQQNSDKFNQTFKLLQQMFYNAKTFPQKKKLIELFIIELTNLAQIQHRIINACNTILNKKGNIVVDDLANSCQLHQRTLQRDFKKITQLTPKEYINIIKLQNTISIVYTRINQFKIVKIDPFYDYSHFYKTFKKHLDLSPKEFNNRDNISIKSIFDI